MVTFAHPLLKWIHGFIAEKSPPWSEEECKNFEHALQMYDKNFHLIQKHKVSVNLWFLSQVYAIKNVYKQSFVNSVLPPILSGHNKNSSRMCGVLLHVEKVRAL